MAMAACAATTTRAALPALGLRAGNSVDRLGVKAPAPLVAVRGGSRTTCADTAIIVSVSTASLLFLGRFVFLPFQRAQVAKAGLPVQNGVTHYEAGDSRAQEVQSLLKTNDPAGFTLVDVLAWGALGHAVAFFILATATNGYEPQF